ncbi:hypothetical protein B1R32_102179 [Abditibacterium utsteinense]|uniref:Uncharacterized protein n=1 Tax=Abditibacterium utsteinense TaxID=1960156 RepID=A0A2S8SWI9_9BACT|nr:hypothetical protein [Abditibacterium utsteinense]PQV65171.1 hypothetical protein B1R32_102179 [Abditibacterium utsteinense]
MDLYTFCLALGFIGLLLMSILGALGGHGSHASHSADAHGFHLHGSGHHEVSLHAHAAHHHGDAAVPNSHAAAHSHHGHAHSQSSGAKILSYLSPRVLFAVSLGVGATGLLIAPYLGEPLRAIGAISGGIGFEKLIISPLWNGLMRFGSNPARTLESALMEEATAVTAFDQNGLGLVSIDLDGHEMRVLARLKPELNNQPERGRVRAGEKLLVEEVDAARGQCRVSRLEL